MFSVKSPECQCDFLQLSEPGGHMETSAEESHYWAFSHYHLAVFYCTPVRDDVPMTPHNTHTYYSMPPR